MDVGILFGRARGEWAADDGLELESDAAEELGLATGLVTLDDLVNGRLVDALRGVPRGRPRTWVYRGWLISPAEYADLYEAIDERGDRLWVNPDEFAAASLVPEWVPELGDATPATVWTEGADAREAWDLALEELGPPPWVIKDHVKSAKERWATACFVPEGADFDAFAAVCEGLVDARGDRFEGGLVVRRFVRLREIPYRTPWGPAHDEHRLVFWDGRLVASAPYFEADVEPLDVRPFRWLADVISSPFFVADVARLADGGTTVLEINDGGCARLPDLLDPRDLYRRIFRLD